MARQASNTLLTSIRISDRSLPCIGNQQKVDYNHPYGEICESLVTYLTRQTLNEFARRYRAFAVLRSIIWKEAESKISGLGQLYFVYQLSIKIADRRGLFIVDWSTLDFSG